MASSGPNYPGTVSATGWTDPDYIKVDDTNYAIVNTGTLNATNFGFSLTGVITGISVNIGAYTDYAVLSFGTVQLIKGGSAQGTNKGADNTFPANVITDRTFGGTSDLWGLTFTAADINASNFGVYLTLAETETGLAVDYVRITITYTPYIDSGIRYTNAASQVKTIAAETLTASHKFRFNKGGTIVGLPLVATDASNAASIRVHDGTEVKSLVNL